MNCSIQDINFTAEVRRPGDRNVDNESIAPLSIWREGSCLYSGINPKILFRGGRVVTPPGWIRDFADGWGNVLKLKTSGF
jgi:hypothetical protein